MLYLIRILGTVRVLLAGGGLEYPTVGTLSYKNLIAFCPLKRTQDGDYEWPPTPMIPVHPDTLVQEEPATHPLG